jgi:hypothetical protein
MSPFDAGGAELLRRAEARGEELRAAWRAANYRRPQADRTTPGRRNGLTDFARAVAGRALIGMGHRLLPEGGEPCV